MKIFLIGFMGAGKTIHGYRLASLLNFNFVDLDNFIEKKYNKTVTEIFSLLGETEFRHIEHVALTELLKKDDIVVSTGGGLPCFNNNMQIISEAGISIYLKMSPLDLAKRLKNTQKKRPLIKNLSNQELKNFVDVKLMEREKYYNQADIVITEAIRDTNIIVDAIKQYLSTPN